MSKNRRGSLMIELVISTILLSVVGAVLVPGIHAVHEQRKAVRYDTHTLIELSNMATKLANGEKPDVVSLTTAFTERYPDSVLSIRQDETTESTTIEIARRERDARPEIVRSLVVWGSHKGGQP